MVSDPHPAGSRLNTGDRIGPYIILDTLGTGGMGEVYRAHDERLGRDVAIKRLTSPVMDSDEARGRVLREARAAAALSHPNIAAVFDVLETPEGLAIVMEFVPGESLAVRLARGPLPPAEALQIGMQIADALAEAHDRGVVHRDLKPANVHLTPARKAKILDFGIARAVWDVQQARPDHAGTEDGRIVGTPGYMAPEQMSGGQADERTDLYGAGLLLFEMLTGRRPFEQRDLFARARAVLGGSVPLVIDLDPSLPADVSAIVARAMALRPEDRFSNARELHGALAQAGRLLSDAPTIDETDRARSRSATGWPSTRRRLKQHWAALAIVGILLAGAALAVWRWSDGAWAPPLSAHGATVAILPLQNGSGDPRNDALAFGLTEGLATRLSSLPSVRVLSLDDSREAARGSDPISAARSLGAAFVVDGALRRNGQTLEVDVTLVRNDGHRTPAGRYTGNAGELFAFHRRVAEGVTAALSSEGLIAPAASAEVAPPTTSQEAFADYTQARLFLDRPDVPGSLEHAIRLFQSAIEKDNRFAQAHAGLGQAYWALYQETDAPQWTSKATAAILDALRIDPDRPEVRLSLAVMYRALGRIPEAQEELRRVLILQPANDDAHRLLGGMHIDRGEWDQAIDEIQEAIALRPNYWRNHSELGFAYYRSGRLDEAAKAYQRVTELQPDSARGFHMLGTVQQAAGDSAAALESYRKANEIRPADSTWSNIGTILYWEGEYAKAAEAYEHAVVLAPNNPELHANLADAQQKLGRDEDALKNYRRAIDAMKALLAVNDKDATNLAVLAMYLAKVGDRPAAEAAIGQALALSPNDGDVLYNRAIVHALAGKTSEACTALEQAVAKGASAEIVRQADELKALKGCLAYDRLFGSRR